MNSSPSLALVLSLLISLSLCQSALQANDNTNPIPLFGSTLYIHGESYQWVEASDTGDYRTDIYTNGAWQYSISVTTKLNGSVNEAALATVSGSSTWGGVDGHLSNGSYGDNYVQSGTPGYGTWETWTYTPNLSNGQLLSRHESTSDDGNGNYSYSWNDSNSDWYSSQSSNNFFGNTSWSESWGNGGSTIGTRQGGSSIELSPTGSITLFGREFYMSARESGWESQTDSSGSTIVSAGSSRESYADADSSLSIEINYNDVLQTATTSVSGWTPEIGAFSGSTTTNGVSDWNTVNWDGRTGPTFAPANLWVDGWLVNWQSGTLNSSGIVEDVYAGAAGALDLRISGNVREVGLANETAQVRMQGNVVGDVNNAQTFNVAGWAITTTGASLPSGSPYFLPAGNVLYVNEQAYEFVEGLTDGSGGHVDVYQRDGTDELRLAGSAVGTAFVAGNFYGSFFNGSLTSGTFTTSGAQVSAEPPLSLLPQALWVRGVFFIANQGTPGLYEWLPEGALVPYTITVTSVANGFEIQGEDDRGTFFGTIPVSGGGMYFIHAGPDANAPQTVPLIKAVASGQPLTSGETPDQYSECPPAAEVAGCILTFIGTIQSQSSAVYAPMDLRTESKWLTVNLNTRATTLTDHSFEPALVKLGSYDTASHLFCTPQGTSSLPEYVHAVLSAGSNFIHMRLDLPAGTDLPPSFLVRGQPWWFAGWDDATNVATYRGFYEGQEMTVDNAVPPEGGPAEHLVTLIDRPRNGLDGSGNDILTQGTLSDVRRSVRLRDGTVVVSGSELGEAELVVHQDDFSLQTIRADLDILGNNLSFGILSGDASLAGALFQFQDQSLIANLHSALSRPQAQWHWWRAGATQAHPAAEVMQLESSPAAHKLKIFSPGEGGIGITLNPATNARSVFQGPILIPESGDIGMGQFTQGPQPTDP